MYQDPKMDQNHLKMDQNHPKMDQKSLKCTFYQIGFLDKKLTFDIV